MDFIFARGTCGRAVFVVFASPDEPGRGDQRDALPAGAACAAQFDLCCSWVEFLHLHGIKKFERATMTRIGRYQVWLPDFTGNASYRRDKLAPLKIFQTKLRQSVNGARVYAKDA